MPKLHLGIPLALYEGGHNSPQPLDWSGISETSTGTPALGDRSPKSSANDRSPKSSANEQAMITEPHRKPRASIGNEAALQHEGVGKRHASEAAISQPVNIVNKGSSTGNKGVSV